MSIFRLNLSFSKFLFGVLFSGVFNCALAQAPIVSFMVKNGEVEGTGRQGFTYSPDRIPIPGQARVFGVNGLISLTVNVSPSSCGYNNGSVIITATGGNPPYLFRINPGWTQNTGNFPNLSPGTYNFIVTDINGETTTVTVAVSNAIPGPSVSFVSSTHASSCSASDATVTVQGTGGTPPYEYSLDLINFQASNTFTNMSNGAYIFYVKDANGCIAALNSFNYTWNLGCSSLPLSVGHSASACTNTGIIDIYTTDQVNAPYTYSLDGGAYQGTGFWQNLPPGIHSVLIKDVHNFVYVVTIGIPLYCGIGIDFIIVNAACQAADGELTVSASGGATPYTYTLDGINFQSGNVFTGLSSGNYYVTVKDANGFSQSAIATINDRCPVATAVATGETCALDDGTITVNGTNGTPPYQYSIDGINFQAANIFSGLSAGNYTVTLKDALGFTTTTSASISNECLSVVASVSEATCGLSNGTITAIASNGTAPYQYSKDGLNFQTSGIFTGLAAGNYIIIAKDINNHIGSISVSVSNIEGPQINVIATPVLCGAGNGSIQISGSGGTLPFLYSIDGSNYYTSGNFSNLSAGSYLTWIKDVNGCLASQPVIILINCPLVNATITNETCSAGNGEITVSASAGTPPYQYSIDGTNFQVSNLFAGLSSGTYTLTVRDALGATNTTNASINNICPSVTVSVINGLCGNANATVTASGSGGNAPYEYSIDGINFQTNNIFTGLSSGDYTITIRDGNGLMNSVNANVENFPGPVISVTSVASSCLNNDGKIVISNAGGTPSFQFSLNGVDFQSNNIFDNIASGSYTGTIKDANGCTDSKPVEVLLVNDLNVEAGLDITICEGLSTTTTAVSNGAIFNWSPAIGIDDPGHLSPVLSPSVTTRYYLTANLGICSSKDSLTVFVKPAPIANAGKDTTICYGQSVQLNGNGGDQYIWIPSTYLDDPHIFDPMAVRPTSSIKYTLQVSDVNGCRSLNSSTVFISVTPAPKVFAGNDTSIVINAPFTLKAIDISSSNFVDYHWSPDFGLNNSTVQSPVAILDRDMTYTLTATTAAGCQGKDEIWVKVYKGPEIYVPTAFSPNGDGKNDILWPIPVGIRDFKYFVIYNRWGQRIFFSRDPARGWDGTIGGIKQDTGTYVWIAEGIDETGIKLIRKGNVTLVR